MRDKGLARRDTGSIIPCSDHLSRIRPKQPLDLSHKKWLTQVIQKGLRASVCGKIAAEYDHCRQRHGNLLLNLSPTAGRLADEAVDTLQEAARIIKRKS